MLGVGCFHGLICAGAPVFQTTLLLMKLKANTTNESFDGWQLFQAEAQYAESIFRDALRDEEASIAAARRAVESSRTMRPRFSQWARLNISLVERPKGGVYSVLCFRCRTNLQILWKIIDKAGNFHIQSKRYSGRDGAL